MRKMFVVVLLCISPGGIFAQKFGVRAGVNLANASFSGYTPSISVGLNAGIFVNFHVAPVVSIQPELAYSTMGFKNYTVSVNGVSNTSNVVSNYLVLPVLVRVKLPLTGLAVYAGPQYGIILSANATTVSGVSSDIKDGYKSGDFAAVGGLEYSLPFGLFGTARYQAGITNVSSSAGFTQKNNAFTFLVGYKF